MKYFNEIKESIDKDIFRLIGKTADLKWEIKNLSSRWK